MDLSQLNRSTGDAAQLRSYPPVARGYILTGPKSFAEGVVVILPDAGTDRHYGPCPWNAVHGNTLPAAGAECIVTFDNHDQPTVVWWEGIQGEPAEIPRGTELPVAPADGQEYDYVASAAAGVIWRLRYRAASASAHKWEFVGGSDAYTSSSGSLTSANGSGAESLEITGAPAITPPLNGDYYVTMECLVSLQVVGATNLEVFLVKNKEIATRTLWLIFIATAQFAGAWLQKRESATLEGGVSYQMYAGSLNKLNSIYEFCRMSYVPIRVG